MVHRVIRFACKICGSEYKAEEQAVQCETQNLYDNLADVGDYVTCGEYGWWTGWKHWMFYREPDPQSESHFDHRPGYRPIYRVVAKAVDTEGRSTFKKGIRFHQMRYLLWSPSHADGKQRFAWTGNGHIPMTAVGTPPGATKLKTPRLPPRWVTSAPLA